MHRIFRLCPLRVKGLVSLVTVEFGPIITTISNTPLSSAWNIALTLLIFADKSGADLSSPEIVLESKFSEKSDNSFIPSLSLSNACSVIL